MRLNLVKYKRLQLIVQTGDFLEYLFFRLCGVIVFTDFNGDGEGLPTLGFEA